MNLFLLRHAPAETRGETWKGSDKDRPLSRKGSKKMEKIAKALKRLDLAFDVILTSPAARAGESAEIVAGTLRQVGTIRISNHLNVGGSARALVSEIRNEYGKCENVLLVGHEPGLSRMISVFLTGQQSPVITMKKGSVCMLTVRVLRYGRCAKLEWLMSPAGY